MLAKHLLTVPKEPKTKYLSNNNWWLDSWKEVGFIDRGRAVVSILSET